MPCHIGEYCMSILSADCVAFTFLPDSTNLITSRSNCGDTNVRINSTTSKMDPNKNVAPNALMIGIKIVVRFFFVFADVFLLLSVNNKVEI